MSNTNNHPWSLDHAGQAAIRRAEDGRTDPVPTLDELFAAVPWMMPKQISGSDAQVPENKGDTMPADGLRTERVTLEVTHNEFFPVSEWSWITMLRLRAGESVRVVEETHFDDLAQVAMERDAAREECERLRARVAELEATAKLAPAANAGGEANQPWPMAFAVWGRGAVCGVSVSREDAGAMQREFAFDTEVMPLYAAPPEPRGWLTEEERKAVALAAEQAPESDFVSPSEGDWIRDVLSSILARATPPMVKVPHLDDLEADERPVWESACEAWIAAIREAGVEVAE